MDRYDLLKDIPFRNNVGFKKQDSIKLLNFDKAAQPKSTNDVGRVNATYNSLLYTIDETPLSKNQKMQCLYIVLFLLSIPAIFFFIMLVFSRWQY